MHIIKIDGWERGKKVNPGLKPCLGIAEWNMKRRARNVNFNIITTYLQFITPYQPHAIQHPSPSHQKFVETPGRCPLCTFESSISTTPAGTSAPPLNPSCCGGDSRGSVCSSATPWSLIGKESAPSSLIGLMVPAPYISVERVERRGAFVPSSLTGLLIPSLRRSALLSRMVGAVEGEFACQFCSIEGVDTGDVGDDMFVGA
jgi:hypothetical protein